MSAELVGRAALLTMTSLKSCSGTAPILVLYPPATVVPEAERIGCCALCAPTLKFIDLGLQRKPTGPVGSADLSVNRLSGS